MAEKQWNEAKEKMGKMLRWTEQPKDQKQADSTIYKGDVIQGIYKRMKTEVGQNDSNVYEIELEGGELVSMWGTTLLDGKFSEVPVGSEVRVSFLGRAQPKTPGGRAYDNFKVEWAAPVMKEAGASVASQPSAPTSEGY